LFFDGEEAFKEWSSTDSIYGARNLAQKWSGLTYTHKGVSGNFLERIDMFVLLDLLGAKDPNIFSLNPSTQVLSVKINLFI
jgi:glutaminyl-peptide cyclotransferase